ncbi:MAG: HAMP domain-containing protein [Lysobacteraceae bacterium]|nr:MAG: HAMP domain-containing protein [Xanthomonadaceae bacterium]
MSLRLKLLLVALSTLALPWAGWQFVRQTEVLLREGREQALLASARMLASALVARGLALPPADALYVHALDEAVVVDGYGDDWAAVRAHAQAVGSVADPARLQVLLGEARNGVHLFLDVRDATRTRVDPSSPRAPDGDHVVLLLEQDGEARSYLLSGAAPGSFRTRAREHGTVLPEELEGALQEDGSGYRIELRLPRAGTPRRIGLAMHDAARPGDDVAVHARELDREDATVSREVAPLVPAHARVRILSAQAHLLAAAGSLDLADAVGTTPGWFASLVYRVLIAPRLDGSPGLALDSPRFDERELRAALAGTPATSWRAADVGGGVVLAAAVPLDDASGRRGALLFEQADAAVPALARRALTGLALATLSALVVAGLVLLAFGATLSWRIRRLRDAAERAVRTSGRLDGPMPLADSRDELGDLARSFARLVDEVRAYTDYLRSLASKLSHELNTPLAIVKSSLDNLEHEPLPESTRAYLARARQGAERLGAIVRAMSEANRIERAIASAEAEDFDLRALVAACGEGYRVLAQPRRLDIALPPGAVPMHGAPDLVAQALDKLFDNACSFTPAQGRIAISLQLRDGEASIRVANSGPLLQASMQERLFDSLVSLRERAAPREGAVPHLGLGLYVVRLVAELHRGRASAANLADGSGVEFTITLAGMPRRRLAEGESA